MKRVTIIFLISMIWSVSKGQGNSFDGFNGHLWGSFIYELNLGPDGTEYCNDFHRISVVWAKIGEYSPSIFEKFAFCNISTNDDDYAYVSDYKVEWIDYDYICEKDKRENYCRLYAGSYSLERLSKEDANIAFSALSELIEDRYGIEGERVELELLNNSNQETMVFFFGEDSMIELSISDEFIRFDVDERRGIYDGERRDIIIKYSNLDVIIKFEKDVADTFRNRLPL